jgi:hypothetical protein
LEDENTDIAPCLIATLSLPSTSDGIVPDIKPSVVVDASLSDGILLPTNATTITTTTTMKGAKRPAVRRTLSRILLSGARASARLASSSYSLDNDESIFVGVSPPGREQGPGNARAVPLARRMRLCASRPDGGGGLGGGGFG